jgi:A/G-specific adenine glycosylase
MGRGYFDISDPRVPISEFCADGFVSAERIHIVIIRNQLKYFDILFIKSKYFIFKAIGGWALQSTGMNNGPEHLKFRRRLLAWFDESARDLPWRRSRDPYAIWVSEIMLQQTRVAAVLEHYARFMKRFASLEALAAAREDEVLALWSGLGYYRRARMLHGAAQFTARELGGKLPSTAKELRALPGIGDYTSAAVASIGFGEAVACVDGNVERVVRRLYGWDERRGTAAKVRMEAAKLLDRQRPGDFNEAMMELGAMVCLPRGPLCLACPVGDMCETQGEHPVTQRKKMRSQEAAYALVERGATARSAAKVLLEQRPADASLMPGMWELPAIDAADATEEECALTLRHSITDTNYSVTIYRKGSRQLGRKGAVRRWFATDDLPELAVTGLARKALWRLRVWPGAGDKDAGLAHGSGQKAPTTIALLEVVDAV